MSDLLGVFEWKPSGKDFIDSILGATGIAGSSFGGLEVGLILAACKATEVVVVLGGAIVSSGIVGYGSGMMLDRYMTGVIGQPLGSYAFDVWEKTEQAFSGAEKDEPAC